MNDTQLLADRAASFRQQILEVATGPGGMIISFPRFDTRRPFQEGEQPDWHKHMNLDESWGGFSPKPTMAEWIYGENTLWITGWLLYSQILRYRVTGEAEALDTARKCFYDLHNIFRLCRAIEPGLLGKPHGGRAGPTTSYDQAASPVLFYTLFAQEYATPQERAEAVANMADHGDYYLRRNWVMNHHGNLQRVVDPSHTSTMKYLACVYAAYEMTGETRFLDAVRKYLRQIIKTGKLPWPTPVYEINHNQFYWGFLCDYWSRSELADEADFIGCIATYWRAAQTARADDMVLFGHYDTVAGTFTPHPDRWVSPADATAFPAQAPRQTPRRWISSTSMPGRAAVTACMAALALLARSHGLDDQAHAMARRHLLRLDDDSLRWAWDAGALPDEQKPLLNLFGPEVAAMWLTAYWMGRQQRVW